VRQTLGISGSITRGSLIEARGSTPPTGATSYVRFTDTFGTNWDHYRALSNVDLNGRKIQQQIDDICLAGRLSRPFIFNGKIHIMPLRALTTDELAACPVFTDEGDSPNVVFDEPEEAFSSRR
jgi:hypothetical protein